MNKPHSDTLEIKIWLNIKANNTEGVIEIFENHFSQIKKDASAKRIQIPRWLANYSLKGKNPTVKTLAKLVHSFEKFHK